MIRQILCVFATILLLTMSPVLATEPSHTDEQQVSQNAARFVARYLDTDTGRTPANMTVFGDRELYRGSECPRGSGRYCSDYLPYCCRSAQGTPYCAKNANGCTR